MTMSRPQRLTAPAPIGSLFKRTLTLPAVREEKGARDLFYLAQIRECPCLSCGMDPCGEAAHVRFASAAFGKSSGMAQKPDDKWALPVCGWDHRLLPAAQHQRREQDFWFALGINPLTTATRLFSQRNDLVAMRAVVFCVIAERGKK